MEESPSAPTSRSTRRRARRGLLALLGIVGAISAAAVAPATGTAAPAAGGAGTTSTSVPGANRAALGSVQLPRDAAPHHDPVEWWYVSGHLSGHGPSGKAVELGYEYVTFQFTGVGPKPVYVGNLAVTDLDRRSFQYGATESSYSLPASPGRFALHTGAWSMSGGGVTDSLRAAIAGYGIDLQLRSTEPPVLEGPHGVVDLGPLGRSYYYSWTSLATTGTVDDHGTKLSMRGTSWMDHEWGSIDVFGGYGWDWFSIQLSDHRQYMLYFIRDKAGKIVQSLATHADASGSSLLAPGSFGERATGSWKSPTTHITYGSGWKLTVPGGELTVVPDLVDQELDLRSAQGNVYWEGDCTISGTVDNKRVTGVGYTELNPPGQAL